jgi:hypothetical protein
VVSATITPPPAELLASNPAKFLPATLAIMLQLAVLLCLLALSWLVQWLAVVYFQFELHLPILVYVLLQALLAALFSRWLNMASWWGWIHAGFPLAMWLMAQLALPSEWYLLGFVVSLALFWTTFRTQVPFFPSKPAVWQQVALLLPATPQRMVDIGSGLGDLSMHLSKLRPDCMIEGIEIAPLPWLLSYLRARLRRSAAKFSLGDYRALDFASYDLVFAYLSPAAMHELWQKAQLEMRAGSMLLSYEFDIPGVAATQIISTGAGRPPLYVWRMPLTVT